MNLSINLVFF